MKPVHFSDEQLAYIKYLSEKTNYASNLYDRIETSVLYSGKEETEVIAGIMQRFHSMEFGALQAVKTLKNSLSISLVDAKEIFDTNR